MQLCIKFHFIFELVFHRCSAWLSAPARFSAFFPELQTPPMCCLSESGVGLQLRHTGVYLLTFPVGMRLKVLLFGAGCCRHMILPRLRLRRVEERSCPSPTMSLQAFFIRAIQPRSPLAIRVSSSVNRPRFPIGLAAQSGTYVSQDLTESPNFLRLVSDNSDRPILPPCRHRRFLHRRLFSFSLRRGCAPRWDPAAKLGSIEPTNRCLAEMFWGPGLRMRCQIRFICN